MISKIFTTLVFSTIPLLASAASNDDYEKLKQLCNDAGGSFSDGRSSAKIPIIQETKTSCVLQNNHYSRSFSLAEFIKKPEATESEIQRISAGLKTQAVEENRKKADRQEKWQSRIGKAKPLTSGKSYECELNPTTLAGSLASLKSQGILEDTKVKLSVGSKSINLGSKTYMLTDNFDEFSLYIYHDQRENKSTELKLLTTKGIKGGNNNLVADDMLYYYCE